MNIDIVHKCSKLLEYYTKVHRIDKTYNQHKNKKLTLDIHFSI